jgi:hypothetical protein
MEELTAYHEAGHVFVAVHSGAIVESVTIDPDWDDGPNRYGDVQIRWPTQTDDTPEELAEKRILIALAGPVTEMIFTGDPFHPAMVAEWSMDWDEAWNVTSSFIPDEKKRLNYLEQKTIQLYQLLHQDSRWALLSIIVDHLLAHETLDSGMIEEIISEWRIL